MGNLLTTAQKALSDLERLYEESEDVGAVQKAAATVGMALLQLRNAGGSVHLIEGSPSGKPTRKPTKQRQIRPSPRETNPEKCLSNLLHLLETPFDPEDLVDRVRDCLDAGVKDTDTRLLRDVTPFIEMLVHETRFKSLRKSIRNYLAELEDNEEEDNGDGNSTMSDDWPHLEQTFGKRVLVLGGDKRELTMDRIRDAFLFEDVKWETGLNKRRVKAQARKVENGHFDFVLLLARFAGHDLDDIIRPACKSAGIPFIVVERGYGVSRVQLELERHFGGW